MLRARAAGVVGDEDAGTRETGKAPPAGVLGGGAGVSQGRWRPHSSPPVSLRPHSSQRSAPKLPHVVRACTGSLTGSRAAPGWARPAGAWPRAPAAPAARCLGCIPTELPRRGGFEGHASDRAEELASSCF